MTEAATPFPRAMILVAGMISVLIHLLILIWLHAVKMDFGKPVVDPIQPKRFHLERAKINPKTIERNASRPLSAQRPIELDPSKIVSFSGPLQAPRIPVPKIENETPMPLNMESMKAPVEALSALPVEMKGNVTQIAQSLANEASTQALKETSQALKQYDMGGGGSNGNAIAGVAGDGLPKFQDISSLIKLKSPTMLNRPEFQPILLRLSSDVLFEFDSAEIQPNAEPILEKVAQIIREATKAKITIEGHTDMFGSDEYNMRLSEQRAQAVASWLASQMGLEKRSFGIRGYGKSRPIVNPYGTKEEQAKNRRVEIRIEAEK